MRSLSRTWPPTTDRYARMRKRVATVPDADELRAEFEAAWTELATDPQKHRIVVLPPSRKRPTRAERRRNRMRKRPRRVRETAALSTSIAGISRHLAEGGLTINQTRAAMGLEAIGPVGDTAAQRRPDDLPGALAWHGLAMPEPFPSLDTDADLEPYDLTAPARILVDLPEPPDFVEQHADPLLIEPAPRGAFPLVRELTDEECRREFGLGWRDVALICFPVALVILLIIFF